MKLFRRKKEISEEEKQQIVEKILSWVEEELSKVNEQLSEEEGQALRELLLSDVVKEAFKKRRTETILKDCVSIWVGVRRTNPAMIAILPEWITSMPLPKKFKDKYAKKYDPTEAVHSSFKLPDSFIEKWSKTKAYRKFWALFERIGKIKWG